MNEKKGGGFDLIALHVGASAPAMGEEKYCCCCCGFHGDFNWGFFFFRLLLMKF
jgi:hypothetical protein